MVLKTIAPIRLTIISAAALLLAAGCIKMGIQAPELEIMSVSDITQTTATCRVKVNSTGNSEIGELFLDCLTHDCRAYFDTSGAITPGVYTFHVKGLYPETLYTVATWATNASNWYASDTVTFSTPPLPGDTVTDVDSNTYHMVTINSQTWLFENLKVTHYRNGDPIDLPGGEIGDTKGWYAWYENNSTRNKPHFGALYNWYAVRDPRGICPAGWRVPTAADFTNLISFLGGAAKAGVSLKEAGYAHWGEPLDAVAGTNESGFTALPGGAGTFTSGISWWDQGSSGYLWSWTDYNPGEGNCLFLSSNSGDAVRTHMYKTTGLSVRCIKE